MKHYFLKTSTEAEMNGALLASVKINLVQEASLTLTNRPNKPSRVFA